MSDPECSSNPLGVSVVIATLGGESLAGTIAQLNRGTLVPDEILVCIPEREAPRSEKLSFGNVKIIKTPCRGQVAQRAFGFQLARNDLVLQLDDDTLLRSTCLENLVVCMAQSVTVAVGPKLYDVKTGKYHSFLIPEPQKSTLFQKLMFWVVNGRRGYEPGRIGRAGIGMGIPERPGTWADLGWLPGCCVLHRRKNLVLFDFYPFKGKAFAEDLYHSQLLRRKGVKLVRCDNAACDVDFSSGVAFNLVNFIRSYLAYAISLKQLVKDIGGTPVYLYVYLFLNLVGLVAKKIVLRRQKA